MTKKKILIVIVVLVVGVVFLLITGALKFSFTVKQTGQASDTVATEASQKTEAPKKVVQQEKLASKAISFKSPDGLLTFNINLPIGWATVENKDADLVAGSLTSETLASGQSFTPNINAISGKHPSYAKTFAEYQTNWKDKTLEGMPSVEFLRDYSTKVNGVDVYVFEIKNVRADGEALYQVQYAFYLSDTYALVATGTAPYENKDKYEDVIKKSIESVKQVD